MQRECRLPAERLTQGDAPPLSLSLAVARFAGAERDPSQVLVADQERRHERHAEPLPTDEVSHVGGHPLVVRAVLDCLVPARLVRKQMTPKTLTRKLRRLPLGTADREDLAVDMRHPDVAALLILVDQPDGDLVAFALLGKRLEQRAEEAVDIRLAYQGIDRELHDIGLNLRQALGAPPLEILPRERSAQRVQVSRINRRCARILCVAWDEIGVHRLTLHSSPLSSRLP